MAVCLLYVRRQLRHSLVIHQPASEDRGKDRMRKLQYKVKSVKDRPGKNRLFVRVLNMAAVAAAAVLIRCN